MNRFVRCHNCGSSFPLSDPVLETEIRCRNCGVMLDTSTPISAPMPEPDALIDLHPVAEPAPELLPHAYTPPPPEPPPEFPPHIVKGRTFWGNLFRLMIPFRSGEGLAGFCFICLIAFLIPWLSLLMCIGHIAQMVIIGYLFSNFFQILISAAEGTDDFHDPDSLKDCIREFWREIFDPFWQFVVSFVYAFAPVLIAAPICSHFTAANTPPGSAVNITLMALLAWGVFIWPMVLLIIACDDFGMLLRPDLIIVSIFRVIGPYLAAFAVLITITFAGFYAMGIVHPKFDELSIWDSVLCTALTILAVYTMRVIGLIYRHYAHKLPWEMK